MDQNFFLGTKIFFWDQNFFWGRKFFWGPKCFYNNNNNNNYNNNNNNIYSDKVYMYTNIQKIIIIQEQKFKKTQRLLTITSHETISIIL